MTENLVLRVVSKLLIPPILLFAPLCPDAR